jgi:hypothetical protein
MGRGSSSVYIVWQEGRERPEKDLAAQNAGLMAAFDDCRYGGIKDDAWAVARGRSPMPTARTSR